MDPEDVRPAGGQAVGWDRDPDEPGPHRHWEHSTDEDSEDHPRATASPGERGLHVAPRRGRGGGARARRRPGAARSSERSPRLDRWPGRHPRRARGIAAVARTGRLEPSGGPPARLRDGRGRAPRRARGDARLPPGDARARPPLVRAEAARGTSTSTTDLTRSPAAGWTSDRAEAPTSVCLERLQRPKTEATTARRVPSDIAAGMPRHSRTGEGRRAGVLRLIGGAPGGRPPNSSRLPGPVPWGPQGP